MKSWMLVLPFCVCVSFACADEPSKPQRAAKLSDLAWLAGHWVDDAEGNLSEETWGPPAGDCMIGMWRLVINGKAKLYELLTITAEGDQTVMRLRHFDRSGKAWEDKESPLTLPLVGWKNREAVFQGKEGDGILRITYRRVDDNTLLSIVEEGASEDKLQRNEFRFRRKSL